MGITLKITLGNASGNSLEIVWKELYNVEITILSRITFLYCSYILYQIHPLLIALINIFGYM